MLPAALLAENIVQEDIKPPIFSENDIEIIFRLVLIRDFVDRFVKSRSVNSFLCKMALLLTKTHVHTYTVLCCHTAILYQYGVCTPIFVRTWIRWDIVCTCANVYVRVAEFGMMIRMWVEACAFFGNVGRVGVVGICVSMKDECETKAKSETAIFILLARIVCRHTLPRQAASSSGWSCSEQMCPTVCYVFTLLCVSFSGLVRCRVLEQRVCF